MCHPYSCTDPVILARRDIHIYTLKRYHCAESETYPLKECAIDKKSHDSQSRPCQWETSAKCLKSTPVTLSPLFLAGASALPRVAFALHKQYSVWNDICIRFSVVVHGPSDCLFEGLASH